MANENSSDTMSVHVQGTYKGFPYEGPPIDIKESDPDHFKPTMLRKVHVKQFDTTDVESLKEYEEISQKLVMGRAVVSFEERRFDLRLKGWRILLRWFEVYYGKPVATPAGTFVGDR